MPVSVRVRLRNATERVRSTAVRRVAEHLLDAVGESRSELGVELVGDRRMRRLNRQYRGRDVSTDVLAFSIREAPGPASPLMGDVVISIPAVYRQACDHRHSADDEFAILLIHGILHLCGYDHEGGGKEAQRMRRQERRLFDLVCPLPRLLKCKPSKPSCDM
jgi:rRNA maturation RNase YbeY